MGSWAGVEVRSTVGEVTSGSRQEGNSMLDHSHIHVSDSAGDIAVEDLWLPCLRMAAHPPVVPGLPGQSEMS